MSVSNRLLGVFTVRVDPGCSIQSCCDTLNSIIFLSFSKIKNCNCEVILCQIRVILIICEMFKYRIFVHRTSLEQDRDGLW